MPGGTRLACALVRASSIRFPFAVWACSEAVTATWWPARSIARIVTSGLAAAPAAPAAPVSTEPSMTAVSTAIRSLIAVRLHVRQVRPCPPGA